MTKHLCSTCKYEKTDTTGHPCRGCFSRPESLDHWEPKDDAPAPVDKSDGYRCPRCGEKTDKDSPACINGLCSSCVLLTRGTIYGAQDPSKPQPHHRQKADATAPTMTDEQVVERFNKLVQTGRVSFRDTNEYGGGVAVGTSLPVLMSIQYSITPLVAIPRYRAFNTSDSFKVDEFDGMVIRNKVDPIKTEKVRAIFCGGFNLESGRNITWSEAVADWLTDNGEPFGVKED